MKFVCDVCGKEFEHYKSQRRGKRKSCGKPECNRAVKGPERRFVRVPIAAMEHLKAAAISVSEAERAA